MRKILSRSTRHIILLCFEVIAAVLAVVLLAWGGLLLRLDQGPINMSVMSGTLQQTLNSNIDDYDLKFDNVQLGWGGLRTPLELQLSDVEVYDKSSGAILAGISQVGMEVSKKALITGDIAPSAINFYNIGLRVYYDADDGISLTLNHREDISSDTNILDFLQPKNPSDTDAEGADENDVASKLRYLKTVRVIDADILIQSQNFSEDVVLKDTRIVMKKDSGQLTATLDGTMNIRENETPLLGHIYFNPDAKTNIASLHFSDLEIKDVKSLISEEWRKRLTLEGEFKGTSHISFDSEFKPQNVRFEVNVKDGRFNFDNVFEKPIAFENLGMVSAFDFDNQEMVFEDVRISNGELEVTLKGQSRIFKEQNERRIELESALKNLPVNDIGEYWPQNVIPAARNWVSQNIRNGLVTSARQKLNITSNLNDDSDITVNTLEGEIHFEKADVTYIDSFPKVENVSGTALFDPQRFVININGGLYNQTKVTPSKITIDGFDGQARADIALNLQTNFNDALNILDHEPYMIAQKMNLPRQDISGDAAVNLNFKFPLKTTLESDEIEYNATAASYNFNWKNIFKGQDLQNAKIDLIVDDQQMSVKGQGGVSGKPATFDYLQYFKHPSLNNVLNVTTTIQIQDFLQSRADDFILATGAVPVKIQGRSYTSGIREYDIDAGLQSMAFDIPALKVAKGLNIPGEADFTLVMQNDVLTEIRGLDFKTPVLQFDGDITVIDKKDENLNWSRADLKKLKFNRNDLDVSAKHKGEEITLKIDGRQFDLTPFFKGGESARAAVNSSDISETFKISGDIDRLITSDQGGIDGAKLFYVGRPSVNTSRLELDGTAGRGQIYLRYRPDDAGLQTLRVEADDAGAALQVLGYSNSIRGGVLVIEGRPVGAQAPRDLQGRFQLSNFTVVDAPVLARLLNGLSVTGLSALLQGEGINFARLSGDFKWQDKQTRATSGGLLTVSDGKTSGASLGLTFGGSVDMARNTLDLEGNLVPVSKLNTAFSEIPVLGDLLTGGGDGIFAATYSIKGDIKAPETTVNPLAVLAPGVLRDIFFEQNPGN